MYLKKVEECRWSVATISGVLDYNFVTCELKDNWDYSYRYGVALKSFSKRRDFGQLHHGQPGARQASAATILYCLLLFNRLPLGFLNCKTP